VNESIWHHYLGLGQPRELILQRELGVIDSNDSSSPIWHGIVGVEYDNSWGGLVNGKSPIPVNFHFNKKEHAPGVQKFINQRINKNIEVIKYFTR
jgi:hypothetical protein